ncbi:ATP-binding protein [Lentzea californiensis]|uniref:ATP-binding protein n=1 Tax=Lentzea californiensis TaxID=438851 RepID=UPI002164FAD0|nr:ATP-binding protein [Lentzea californiensis]MCR3753995.1 Histidine kinase-like ATPase domain [Lentzea californiensis]
MTARVVDLPVRPGMSMASLRRHLAAALQDLGEDHLYDVQLVVTELVANVLDHTPSTTGHLRVLRGQEPCAVIVEVDDESAVHPVYGRSRLGENRGRGIVVVDNISREWGCRPRGEGGKTVFALVECTGT